MRLFIEIEDRYKFLLVVDDDEKVSVLGLKKAILSEASELFDD